MLVSILENGRHLGFLIGPSGRIDLVTIEMPYANFGACITICTIHPKNACYLLHYMQENMVVFTMCCVENKLF